LPQQHGPKLASENRRTSLREVERHVGDKYTDAVLDSLYVIECSMRHFFLRAEMRKHTKHTDEKADLIDADYEKAAHLAALVAPYRHARLSAMKLAGDPNNPAGFSDDATADELRAEIMKRLAVLTSAGLIDLQALPTPDGGTVNKSIPGVDQSRINGQ
jgi:hypothetical protein